MVNLTIDDKQVTAPKNSTIYDAARINGIKIPILCHDNKLKPFGACRMCLVEVEQMKGRQIPACTTPITEGMIIRTATDDIIKARKLVLELLLLNHPLDCPVCDKAGDCDLQNLTYEYKVDGNRFADEKFHHEIDYNNPLIERDMNRCVLCGKCARICDEIVSYGALTFIDRGIETKIGCEFERGLNCEFCGSCVSVCPVGSLLARPFKFKARFWALTNKKSICGYCGTGCNVTLGVKDNQVLTTVYDDKQGFHKGQLCCRGRFGYQYINSTKRLQKPLIRKNGSLVETTWDEALQFVAARLAAGNVAALGGERLTNEEVSLFKQLMEKSGSKQYDHAAGYAHTALTAGFARSFGMAASSATIPDIQKSSHLLVIKTDAYETNPVVGFEINMAVKNKNVTLSILSDKRGKLSKLPDAITLTHAPATEIAVLNALSKSIIEQNLVAESARNLPGYADLAASLQAYTPEAVAGISGVSAEAIRNEAAGFAAAEKAMILFPVGQAYPGHNADLATAAANLAILTGKYDREGCGVLCLGEKSNSQGVVDLGFYGKDGCSAATILANAASGSVKTLLIAGENPLVSYPNKQSVQNSLDKVECLIVSELFMTETAAMADVVLPACSIAEKEGTLTASDRRVQYVKPAIPRVGQSRSDFDIFKALLAAAGVTVTSPKAVFAEITTTVKGYQGMSYQSLGEEGAFASVVTQPALVPVAAAALSSAPGKLALVVGSALYHNGSMSQYGEGPMHVCPEGYVELSHSDAARLSVVNDGTATVASAHGTVTIKVKVTSRMPVGVAFAPYHFSQASINQIWSGEPVTWVTISK